MRAYKGRQAMDFIMSNPGKQLTIEAIQKGIDGWPSASVSGLCSKMVREYPENMTRVGAGIYVWNESPENVAVDNDTATMTLKILSVKNDGTRLVQDVSTDKIYVMKDFEF